MKDFFASLYEWWGLLPFYSTDMGDHLRGYDITCSDYIGTPWYFYIGFIMILVTIFIYALEYHIIDSTTNHKKMYWWIFALVVVALNFLIAFTIPFNTLQAGDYCNQLNITVSDCIGFGFSNALWSFIFYILITSFPYPRALSRNFSNATFWKP